MRQALPMKPKCSETSRCRGQRTNSLKSKVPSARGVGGPMHSIEEGSKVAAAVAVRILNGEKAGDIKTPPTRFASPRIRLAADAALGDPRERPAAGQHGFLQAPAVWETYRWQLVTIITVLLFQGALILPYARTASSSGGGNGTLSSEWWNSPTLIGSPRRVRWPRPSRTKSTSRSGPISEQHRDRRNHAQVAVARPKGDTRHR